MKSAAFALCCFVLLGYSSQALSRPVSYPGGWTVMQKTERSAHSLHLHYSPTFRYSVGYRGEYWRGQEWQFHGAQFNYLLKRRNTRSSQANVYLKGGLGMAFEGLELPEESIRPAAFTDVSMDWENRRLYTSSDTRFFYSEGVARFIRQKARIGIAPYLGGYDSLHTWLMLQFGYMTGIDEKFTFTPFVRLFRKQYLGEIGISHRGEFLFNFIIRI